MNLPRHGLIVLAAGASRRLGKSKQLVELQGETLLHRAVRQGLTTEPYDAVVVFRTQAAYLAAAVADLPIRGLECADAEAGMGASLSWGCQALQPDCAGALIMQVDQWQLSEFHLQQLVQLWKSDPTRAVASAYADIVGVPAIIPRAWFARLPQRGDIGARELLRAAAAQVRTIPADSLARDLDDADDLADMQRR